MTGGSPNPLQAPRRQRSSRGGHAWGPAVGLRRLVALVVVGGALIAGAALASGAPLPTPACPPVDGWTPAGTFGPIDQGLGVEYQCQYSVAGQAEQLTLDVSWTKPSARNVDVNFSQCGKAPYGGTYYEFLFSGTALARAEYDVTGGPNDAAIFQADRARIEPAALTLLHATAKLAKPCAHSGMPPPSSASPPRVAASPATGRHGAVVALNFTVAGAPGTVRIVLTIYGGANATTVLFRKDYGTTSVTATARQLHVGIRANRAGASRWCVTATNARGRSATACNSLVVA